jgi:hypothetical protein
VMEFNPTWTKLEVRFVSNIADFNCSN